MSHQEIVEILQRKLAGIDFSTEPRGHSRPGFTELLLLKLTDIKVKIY